MIGLGVILADYLSNDRKSYTDHTLAFLIAKKSIEETYSTNYLKLYENYLKNIIKARNTYNYNDINNIKLLYSIALATGWLGDFMNEILHATTIFSGIYTNNYRWIRDCQIIASSVAALRTHKKLKQLDLYFSRYYSFNILDTSNIISEALQIVYKAQDKNTPLIDELKKIQNNKLLSILVGGLGETILYIDKEKYKELIDTVCNLLPRDLFEVLDENFNSSVFNYRVTSIDIVSLNKDPW